MDSRITQAINYHAYQLAKNFGLQEADIEDVRQDLIFKALTIIEDFVEGEASLVTYVKRCLENKAADIARELGGLPPKVNCDDAARALDVGEHYKYSGERKEGQVYAPLILSLGSQLQYLSPCDHEHNMPLKMDLEPKLENLTPRQKQVAELLEDGLTQERIAEKLGISQKNINKHIRNIRRRFDYF